MRQTFAVGLILLVLGLAGLAYDTIRFTTKEKVLDIGSIEVTQDKDKSYHVKPLAGALAFVGGVLMLLSTRRQ